MNPIPTHLFDNSYARLPDRFFAKLPPTPVSSPVLVKLNTVLATRLGLDPELLATEAGVQMLAGNLVPDGADPLAMVYAGHQFGGWSPQLGDGRAILLGELTTIENGRYDVQLKGSGPTPFSRSGDGRAWLGPVIREYVVSEAMYALAIPTTRALAAVTTGESVYRESAMPGAILTRVARSHIRVGTFEFFAARQDTANLQRLANYVIDRHYPECAGSQPDHALPEPGANQYSALLDSVVQKQAELVARWMSVGFIHGVMNTDNMAVSGQTIDYGPCAFMDTYEPQKVFSSIDRGRRYAYQNQPRVAQWNLSVFAQCLLGLINDNHEAAISTAQAIVDQFPDRYAALYLNEMRAKFGLSEKGEDDLSLITDFLSLMSAGYADFTVVFRALSDLSSSAGSADSALEKLMGNQSGLKNWLERWRNRLLLERSDDESRLQGMKKVNPVYIPRNHLIQASIESALNADFSPFHELVSVLESPYQERTGFDKFAQPPRPNEVVHQTFCGT